ncbi:MAG: ankyrin repeat domain-containing protein [Spirochaetes bacterium]|nr:ankyrin repeat domain-containing protein [Spirochaetota bacterium]
MSQEFFHFCANNKLKEAGELWEKGDIDLEFRYAGYTALLQAASKGYTELAQWLVEIGANLEAASSDGKTALIHAASRGHTDIVEALLNANADKNCADKKGSTPLDYAKQLHKDNKKLIEMLAPKQALASEKTEAAVQADKNMKAYEKFVEAFPPSGQLLKPSEETIEKYRPLVPEELLGFWKKYGFGNYGGGLIKIINPSDYENVPGINVSVDIPLALNSFGDIFIYRNVSAKNVKAVGILNVHYRSREFFIVGENCIEEFFAGVDDSLPIIRAELFKEALAKHGNLEFDEIFFFTPALALGGGEKVKFVEKGKALVHYELLAQMLGADFKAV